MKALIERLEQATEGSHELDWEIAVMMFPGGLNERDERCMSVQAAMEIAGKTFMLPPYTRSIDAAITLLPEGAEYTITTLYGVANVEVGFNFPDGSFNARREDGNVILALVTASLNARETA